MNMGLGCTCDCPVKFASSSQTRMGEHAPAINTLADESRDRKKTNEGLDSSTFSRAWSLIVGQAGPARSRNSKQRNIAPVLLVWPRNAHNVAYKVEFSLSSGEYLIVMHSFSVIYDNIAINHISPNSLGYIFVADSMSPTSTTVTQRSRIRYLRKKIANFNEFS